MMNTQTPTTNVEYRPGEPKINTAVDRRPLWPCRETIAGIVYDRDGSDHICRSGDAIIWRTVDGHYFVAAQGAPIRTCSKHEVIEALILDHIAPVFFDDFIEFLPSVRKAAAAAA